MRKIEVRLTDEQKVELSRLANEEERRANAFAEKCRVKPEDLERRVTI